MLLGLSEQAAPDRRESKRRPYSVVSYNRLTDPAPECADRSLQAVGVDIEREGSIPERRARGGADELRDGLVCGMRSGERCGEWLGQLRVRV